MGNIFSFNSTLMICIVAVSLCAGTGIKCDCEGCQKGKQDLGSVVLVDQYQEQRMGIFAGWTDDDTADIIFLDSDNELTTDKRKYVEITSVATFSFRHWDPTVGVAKISRVSESSVSLSPKLKLALKIRHYINNGVDTSGKRNCTFKASLNPVKTRRRGNTFRIVPSIRKENTTLERYSNMMNEIGTVIGLFIGGANSTPKVPKQASQTPTQGLTNKDLLLQSQRARMNAAKRRKEEKELKTQRKEREAAQRKEGEAAQRKEREAAQRKEREAAQEQQREARKKTKFHEAPARVPLTEWKAYLRDNGILQD